LLTSNLQSILAGEQRFSVTSMTADDVVAICAIEQTIYAFPWTSGNFLDSLRAGYGGWVVSLPNDDQCSPSQIAAYAMTMKLPEEIHLLNISVASNFQRKGLGRSFLRWLIAHARAENIAGMLLEVRPSNLSAIALYRSEGFAQIGLRKGYYPNLHNKREDALVFSLAPL
jgi:[ribosomal protein S18]-alanine N-acetyltransferase